MAKTPLKKSKLKVKAQEPKVSSSAPKSTSLTTTGCGCCDCAEQPSGGVFTCEDGVCVYIPKPSYFAVLVSDPNVPLPYWSRPTDLGLNCPIPPPVPPPPLLPREGEVDTQFEIAIKRTLRTMILKILNA